ncbi:MAG: cyclase family protein [Calditrichota bacterium]
MSLSMFYTRGICLDVSDKGLRELIDIADLQNSIKEAKTEIQPGDTVLLNASTWVPVCSPSSSL